MLVERRVFRDHSSSAIECFETRAMVTYRHWSFLVGDTRRSRGIFLLLVGERCCGGRAALPEHFSRIGELHASHQRAPPLNDDTLL
jgi:hypothetical protein